MTTGSTVRDVAPEGDPEAGDVLAAVAAQDLDGSPAALWAALADALAGVTETTATTAAPAAAAARAATDTAQGTDARESTDTPDGTDAPESTDTSESTAEP